ncbi:MAG: hypothetical protein ACRDPW_10960, partial [Mycobacteriales bacterium]
MDPIRTRGAAVWRPGSSETGPQAPKGYEGVLERFERIYLHTSDNLSERKQDTIRRFTQAETCPVCAGDRLNKTARTATVLDRTIGEMSRLEITELVKLVHAITASRVAPVVAALTARLEAMITIGLGYLTLPGDNEPLGRRVATDQD